MAEAEEIAEGDAEAAETTWAVVELMGHRRRIGRVSEVEIFGGKMLRIDIPVGVGTEVEDFITEFYGCSAIYAYRPMSEELALREVGRWGDPRPVKPADFRLEHKSDDAEDEVA